MKYSINQVKLALTLSMVINLLPTASLSPVSAVQAFKKPTLKMPSIPFVSKKKKPYESEEIEEDYASPKGAPPSATKPIEGSRSAAPGAASAAGKAGASTAAVSGGKTNGDGEDLKSKEEVTDDDGETKSREFKPGVDKPQDEAEEMEEAEWKDNQEQKRKEAILNDLTAPALGPEERDPERFYKQSLILTKQKKYKEALEAINKALKLKPAYWEAQIQGAIVLSLQGRDQEAIERYKHIVNLRPDLLDACINLGSLLGKTGDYAGAEQQYKNVLNRNFYLVSAHFNLANLYIKQGKFDHAIKELKTCIKMKPNHAWAHNNLGVIFQKRKFIEEAQEEFLKALTLQPSNKVFENNLNMMRELLKKKAVKA